MLRPTHWFAVVLALTTIVGCAGQSENESDASNTQTNTDAMPSDPAPEDSSPKSYGDVLAQVKGQCQAIIKAARNGNPIDANAELRDIAGPLDDLERAAIDSDMSDEDKEKVKAAVEAVFEAKKPMLDKASGLEVEVDYDATVAKIEEALSQLESVNAG